MATRLSHCDFDACSRTLRELYAETSLREFPNRLLPLLKHLVPCSHVSYNAFNLNSQPNQFVIHLHPERSEAKKVLSQFGAHYDTHPLRAHYEEKGLAPKKISDVATFRQFQNTAIYQEYYRQMDTRHQMIFFFHHQENSHVGLAFNRQEKDFSERDRGVLGFLQPHIAQAYNNARVATEMACKLDTVGEGLDAMHRAVILAGADGQIHWQSLLAREWLREFFPGERTPERLPASLTNGLRRIKKSSPGRQPVFSEFQAPARGDCRLLIYCGECRSGEYALALVRERVKIDQASVQSYGLTPREAEILFWISEAKTRPEMGAILGISWRTIAKHMEHLFAKLGVENRLEAQRIGRELRRS